MKPDAAGVDIGARQIHVAVPPDRDATSVRTFETFTDALYQIRDWLKHCRIRSVAMESTGVYWIPLFQVLEAAGLEVCLVNARQAKALPGRKTDVQDCQWLQYLHSVGLLHPSFRPPEDVCAVRSILRYRGRLVRCAADQVRLMQKSFTQMNFQIQHVIADLVGATGLAIVDAILAGERDPKKLAEHRDPRVKASTETIVRSLNGDWRPEHLFTLRQSRKTWGHYQEQIAECDRELERMMAAWDSHVDPKEAPLPPPKGRSHPRNEPDFDVRNESYRVLGVDLTAVPGIQNQTAITLLSELGPDFASRFQTSKHFSSWLGLCPDNSVSGGKVLSASTRKVKNRVAIALRVAAQCLYHAKGYFGDLYRRWKARLGSPKAITAMAHKLARVIWHLVKYRVQFDPIVFKVEEERMSRKRLARLQNTAAALGYQLTPVSECVS
jgi:transposase